MQNIITNNNDFEHLKTEVENFHMDARLDYDLEGYFKAIIVFYGDPYFCRRAKN